MTPLEIREATRAANGTVHRTDRRVRTQLQAAFVGMSTRHDRLFYEDWLRRAGLPPSLNETMMFAALTLEQCERVIAAAPEMEQRIADAKAARIPLPDWAIGLRDVAGGFSMTPWTTSAPQNESPGGR